MKSQQTVFSHIVQRELSDKCENVATTALSFILESSDARNGMMKLLRGVLPELPNLKFRTQQTEGNSRPDMDGYDDEGATHVFVENKFWAGLTDNQPVYYLEKLDGTRSTLLLVVVPHLRAPTVWGELTRRLKRADISITDREPPSGIIFNGTTSRGPILALTSWAKLLDFLEVATTNDPAARSDVLQMRALCDQEDVYEFRPFSSEKMSDQEIPSLILQLTSNVVQDALALAFKEGTLHKGRLTPQADTRRIGRYVFVFGDERCGLWFGLHFDLWKKHGRSPLWGVFSTSNFGRATDVQPLLDQWAKENGVLVASEPDGEFAVAFDIPFGEEKDKVIRSIVDRFKEIGNKLSGLKPHEKGVIPNG